MIPTHDDDEIESLDPLHALVSWHVIRLITW